MQDLVLFDIDGTLAINRHRRHYIDGAHPDWRAYENAAASDQCDPILSAVFYDHFTASRDMWIASGRSEDIRELTEDWLYTNGLYYNKLLLKPSGDTRGGEDVKRRWLHDGTIPRERVLCAYDDELAVVRMYREEGITCFHVVRGDT